MRPFACLTALLVMLWAPAFAAAQGPQIEMVDGKLSVKADAVTLSGFFQSFDSATGFESKVPPALASRNISVEFSNLPVDAAVRKIFEGQKLDYVFIGGKGVIVTAAAQTGPITDAPPLPVTASREDRDDQPFPPGQFNENMMAPQQPGFFPPGVNPGVNQGVNQGIPGNPGVNANVPVLGGPNTANAQPEPSVIQTPFGPIPNPRAAQQNPTAAGMQLPAQPQNPFQNASPFGSGPLGSPLGMPVTGPQAGPQTGAPGTGTPNTFPFGAITPGQPGQQPGRE